MTAFRFVRQAVIPSKTIGINAAATNAAITSNDIDVTGANALTLFVEFTRSAATGNLDFTFEGKNPETGNYCTVQEVDSASGTSTLTTNTVRKATGSASQSYEIRLRNLNFNILRIKLASPTAASASDTVTVTGLKAMGPA